jgi:spermidine synthase
MENIVFETDTKFGHYQVVDMVYVGRKARVLFSGRRAAAQSGIPKDGNPAMLFDYNQRFLELTESIKPKTLLLIGGGAFTLPTAILQNLPNTKVDVVEHDPGLVSIAKKYFGLPTDKRLKTISGDGRKYLESTQRVYDLILIDAFTNSVIPPGLSTKEFVELLQEHLSKNGVSASNIISAYHGPHDSVIKQQYATYKSVFRHTDIFPADKILSYWISQNFLLISTNKLIRPKYSLRFASLKPSLINSGDIQYD